jgi:hypothetical protein
MLPVPYCISLLVKLEVFNNVSLEPHLQFKMARHDLLCSGLWGSLGWHLTILHFLLVVVIIQLSQSIQAALTEWFISNRKLFLHFWEVEIKVLADMGSSEVSLSGSYADVFSLCLHIEETL